GRVRCDGLKIRVVDHANPATLHLLEVGAASHHAHEEDTFQRLHICIGGNHVHGDGDPWVVRVAELGDQLVGSTTARLVGDLGGEVVSLAEDITCDLNDLVRVRVVLREDQRLRHLAATGEDLGEEPI